MRSGLRWEGGGGGGPAIGASASATRAGGQEVGGEASGGAAAPGHGSRRENHPSALAASIHLPGRAGWSSPSLLAEGVAAYLAAPFISRLSGPSRAREAEKPGKSSGADLAGVVGGDPGACGLGGSASAPERGVVGS